MILEYAKACRRGLARRVASNELVWRHASKFLKNFEIVSLQRRVVEESRFSNKLEAVFCDLTVLAGPIRGLRYSEATSVGSSLLPKLAGTYESELQPELTRLRAKSYEQIVDVGFAEGYYLLGLSLAYDNAELLGFDISNEAHKCCRENAIANGIDLQRLTLLNDWEPLKHEQEVRSNSLVIVDCEGAECRIFSDLGDDAIRQSDWIVETHDFIDGRSKSIVLDRLRSSHQIKVISPDEVAKKRQLAADEVRSAFSDEELNRVIDEGRPAIQSWIVAERHQSD